METSLDPYFSHLNSTLDAIHAPVEQVRNLSRRLLFPSFLPSKPCRISLVQSCHEVQLGLHRRHLHVMRLGFLRVEWSLSSHPSSATSQLLAGTRLLP